MHNYPITECPNCGCVTFKYTQRISGTGEMRVNLDDSEPENGDMYDGLKFTRMGKYAYCNDCGKRLFEITKIMGF